MNLDHRSLLATALPQLSVAAVAEGDGLWLAGDSTAPAFRVRDVLRRPCLWHADRVADIAADIDAAAPLFDAIETVSGWRFEPGRIVADVQAPVLALNDGATTIELAIDPATPPSATLLAAAAAAPEAVSHPYPRQLVLHGPSLEIATVEGLGVGDLILLGSVVALGIDGAGAGFVLDLTTAQLSGSSLSSSPPDASLRRFAVPVQIALPPIALSRDTLASVTGGTATHIGPLPDGTPVAIRAGGRDLAHGTLARFGAAFAVRLTALAASDDLQ